MAFPTVSPGWNRGKFNVGGGWEGDAAVMAANFATAGRGLHIPLVAAAVMPTRAVWQIVLRLVVGLS